MTTITERDCAAALMDTIPGLMRAIRHHMREQRPQGLSVPQFRALRVILHHAPASVSDVARHLGLTMASASKVIDLLERDGLVTRAHAVEDRRKVLLTPTAHGQVVGEDVRAAAEAALAETLAGLPAEELANVMRGLAALHGAFARRGDGEPAE